MLNTSTAAGTNNANLTQDTYVQNTSYRDEWLFEPFKTMLYGVTNTGHNHAEPLPTVSSYLAGADYTHTLTRTGT